MKNEKGVSAVVGAIILVAAIVSIAACCIHYTLEYQRNVELIESISMNITEYSFDGNFLNVTFNMLNPSKEYVRAHFEVSSLELITENRTVVDEVPRGLNIKAMLISPGNNSPVYCFDGLMMDAGYYKVELCLVTEFAVYNFKPLLIL